MKNILLTYSVNSKKLSDFIKLHENQPIIVAFFFCVD